MEAQRYPDDFDGIVSGAPAYNWTEGLGGGMTHNQQLMFPNANELGTALISKKELQLVNDAILHACDEMDGIKDGILNNPLVCDFDLSTLICEDGQVENCLSPEKISALQSIYNGPKDQHGNSIFYGFPYGGEMHAGGWQRWITGGIDLMEDLSEFQAGVNNEHEMKPVPNAQYGFGPGVLKYMVFHDKEWSIDGYDLNHLKTDARFLESTLNATDPDLSTFRKNGGKLLMYSGWSDAAVTALGTIGYYEQVLKFDSSAAEDVKLFMMPGVQHCIGGDGPSWVNWVDEIDKWVTSQEAPVQMPVYYVDENMRVYGSRMICAYPLEAIYDGSGDLKDMNSFSCGTL
jgi:feruloyl esterase